MGPNAISVLIWLFSISGLLTTAASLTVNRGAVGVPEHPRNVPCQEDAVANCVNSTGLDGPTCFAKVCAPGIDLKVLKRQDTCTEENLIQCAVVEWRQAEGCFQELCL